MTVKKPAAKKAAAAKKVPENVVALHLSNGDDHIVGITALRVLLSKDGNAWFAQGLEVDYFSAGATIEEVKKNFADGMTKTIHKHLQIHGNIDKFLVVAPQDAWAEYYEAQSNVECVRQHFTSVQIHQLGEVTQKAIGSGKPIAFPFNHLAFIEPAIAA